MHVEFLWYLILVQKFHSVIVRDISFQKINL